jgi:type IV secretion system protein TrbG
MEVRNMSLRAISAALLVTTALATPGFAQNRLPGFPTSVPKPLAPNQPLTRKDLAGVSVSHHWAGRFERPTIGSDGAVTWTYGYSQPSIVCAPLHYCDLALHPGEVATDLANGDPVRWQTKWIRSGTGTSSITHIVVKPTGFAESTDLTIYTTQRTYTVKLIYNQSRYTALTKFAYPEEDSEASFQQYRQSVASSVHSHHSDTVGAVNGGGIDFYAIKGDNPRWRPLHCYTDGVKTYIQFPDAMTYGEAPALVGLNHDGTWFTDASHRAVTFRLMGNTWVVDGVEDRLELVSGVDGGQTKVLMERPK